MKRSEINRALRGMEAMLEQHRFALPPFCHYIRLSKKPVIARQSADWSRQSVFKIHNSCIFRRFPAKRFGFIDTHDVMREGRPGRPSLITSCFIPARLPDPPLSAWSGRRRRSAPTPPMRTAPCCSRTWRKTYSVAPPEEHWPR